jgi:uncharacterized protein YecT (DUF1311 family)
MSKKFGAGVFTLLLLLFCAGAARAQESKPATQEPRAAATTRVDQDDVDREDPCPGAQSQHDMNRCAARARERADAELNKVYRQLMKDTSGAERAKLRSAQLAWIKFRDAHCDYESVGNTGGTIYPMVVSFCLARVTADRGKQLQEILRESREQ